MTLNQFAASIANALNQPFNHELKERVKDLFKERIAFYVHRTIERNGISDGLLLSYTAEVKKVSIYNKPIDVDKPELKKSRTVNKVPTPVRFGNDAIFTYVGTDDGLLSFPARNPYEAQITYSFFSTGEFFTYYYANGYIYINDKPNNIFKANYIKIESIFESSEEIIGMYDNTDGQDLELPFPLDIVSLARNDIMQLVGSIPVEDIAVKHTK